MIKNKTKDQEETNQKNKNKTPDYKEDSTNQEHANSNDSAETASKNSKTSESKSGKKGDVASDKVNTEVRAVEEKLAEMQDKYLRLSAEFDNYRKRTLREKMEITRFAGENLLLKIIPLMDDFDRALIHMDTSSDCGAMKNGIDLIYVKFSEFLKENGIKEIESLNKNFNVDLHEAVAKLPVEEKKKKGKVVDVVLKGYYLQDKVLRFSKVVVGE